MNEIDWEELDRFERDYTSCGCKVCFCTNFVKWDDDLICEKCRDGEHNFTDEEVEEAQS